MITREQAIEAGLDPDTVSREVLFTGTVVEYSVVDTDARCIYRFGLISGGPETFVQIRESDKMPYDPELYDSPAEAMSEIAEAMQAFRD
jgi:hypothetical protein